MATKLIIVYPISDSRQIPAMGRYKHDSRHNAHIWDGREYDTSDETDMEQFNTNVLPALSLFPDRLPRCIVKAVYEAPVEPEQPSEDESPIPQEASMPRKRHARLKPGLVPA